MDEYCEVVQNWIFEEDREKLKLGFMFHDMDCDGKISPKDIIDFQTRFCDETSYLLPNDVVQLTQRLRVKIVADVPDAFLETAQGILIEAEKTLEEKMVQSKRAEREKSTSSVSDRGDKLAEVARQSMKRKTLIRNRLSMARRSLGNIGPDTDSVIADMASGISTLKHSSPVQHALTDYQRAKKERNSLGDKVRMMLH